MEHQFENYLNEANLYLNRAELELNKPHEDVMTLSVCQGTKLAIDNFLKAYLIKHQIDDVENGDLLARYNQCLAFNPAMKNIDLKTFDCIHDDHCEMADYCMSISKVEKCVRVAKDLRNLIYR
jgi:hypothetical protein